MNGSLGSCVLSVWPHIDAMYVHTQYIFIYIYIYTYIYIYIYTYIYIYIYTYIYIYGSVFGKRDLLAIDHIMLALFWRYAPNMK